MTLISEEEKLELLNDVMSLRQKLRKLAPKIDEGQFGIMSGALETVENTLIGKSTHFRKWTFDPTKQEAIGSPFRTDNEVKRLLALGAV